MPPGDTRRLIIQWGRMHEAIVQNTTALRCLNRLTSQADEEAFQTLACTHPDGLAPVETAFLKWTAKQHRRNKITKRAALISAVFAAAYSAFIRITAPSQLVLNTLGQAVTRQAEIWKSTGDTPHFAVAFSPDGRVSGSRDKTLRLWDVPTLKGNIFQAACHRLPLVNGKPDRSTTDLAREIGISGLTLPHDCTQYDPPLPHEIKK